MMRTVCKNGRIELGMKVWKKSRVELGKKFGTYGSNEVGKEVFKKILGKLNICSVTQTYMDVDKVGAWWGGRWSKTQLGN